MNGAGQLLQASDKRCRSRAGELRNTVGVYAGALEKGPAFFQSEYAVTPALGGSVLVFVWQPACSCSSSCFLGPHGINAALRIFSLSQHYCHVQIDSLRPTWQARLTQIFAHTLCCKLDIECIPAWMLMLW